jgi:polyphosphate:AMP phosphotransferase
MKEMTGTAAPPLVTQIGISKADFKARVPGLRMALINAQYLLKDAGFSMIVLLAGLDRIGCEQVVDRLHEWMDGRYLDTWFVGQPTKEELTRPRFWRFWRSMPPDGRIGIFVGAWITEVIDERLRGDIDDTEIAQRIRHFNSLDRLLTDDGTVYLKLWLDLPEKAMRKRLKRLDHDHALYVEDLDYGILKHYADAQPIVASLLDKSGDVLPWIVVDGSSARTRDFAVAETILQSLQQRLDNPPRPPVPPSLATTRDHLAEVDLSKALEYGAYRKELEAMQLRLHKLSLKARAQEQGVVMVFEGWDAAGKGGAIRRITQAVSARDCKVIPIGAPTDEELAHHYLWRFWRRLPPDGQMRIFDRSWYGRVLVERVERLARPDEWQRAYAEINDFETQIVEHGHLLLKFWLHIDPDEQMSRFKAREKTGYKKYKITDEDYRNREKWPAYVDAVNEMVDRTSTAEAPWHLVAANDKRWARVQVLTIVCDTLEKALRKRRNDKKK